MLQLPITCLLHVKRSSRSNELFLSEIQENLRNAQFFASKDSGNSQSLKIQEDNLREIESYLTIRTIIANLMIIEKCLKHESSMP